jgi:hypothetical protein
MAGVAVARKSKGKAKRIERDGVTGERASRNQFVSAGMAFRVVPVIETLFTTKRLTEAEYDALLYYRTLASQAEDDEACSGPLDPEKIMGGATDSHPIGGYIPANMIATPAILMTAHIERQLGALRDIARAIAVNDMSLTQWCVERHGGRERYDGKGRFVAIVPIAEKRHVQLALLELKYAAGMIVR